MPREQQERRDMSLTVKEIDSSISIDQITAVLLRTGWQFIEPRSFEVKWSSNKGLMYHLMTVRGDSYYETFGLINEILAVR
jgi:hypothetical protein